METCIDPAYSDGAMSVSVAVCVWAVCGAASSALLVNCSSNWALLLAELCAVLIAVTPVVLPWKALRFFTGLLAFACFMSIHSRILCLLQCRTTDCSVSTRTLVDKKQKRSFRTELLQTYFCNIQHRLESANSKFPSCKRILYTIVLGLIADGCVYLIHEVIPIHLSESSRYIGSALVAGIWILICMDWNYSNSIVFLDMDGCPLPFEMRHRHPLLSTTLAEFWGVRWNPIIGKLLQDAFYKPFRRIGAPRGVCIATCFIGSAILHAWPLYAGTRDLSDAAMMGSFFLGQGGLLLLEQGVLSIMGWSNVVHVPTPGGAHTRAKFQWAAELMVVGAITCGYYYYYEIGPHTLQDWTFLVSLVSACIIAVLGIHYQAEGSLSSTRALGVALGWLWAVGSVLMMLPMFSIPVLHCIDTLYNRSLVVGSFVRAVHKVLPLYS
mmetsp:Transcript_10744/g.16310  ORF Transcript_10744/g.16310 Transcript_10744/m.16310 type:complete len:438 (-) Transcript_10744:49-1362(-)